MNGYTYCGSQSAVGLDETAKLLADRHAIWCPPPTRIPWALTPTAGSHMWLFWRDGVALSLLGGGILRESPRKCYGSNLLWTNRSYPGVRDAAESLGYRGGTGMAFLRLDEVSICERPVRIHSVQVPIAFGLADAPMMDLFRHICPLSGMGVGEEIGQVEGLTVRPYEVSVYHVDQEALEGRVGLDDLMIYCHRIHDDVVEATDSYRAAAQAWTEGPGRERRKILKKMKAPQLMIDSQTNPDLLIDFLSPFSPGPNFHTFILDNHFEAWVIGVEDAIR